MVLMAIIVAFIFDTPAVTDLPASRSRHVCRRLEVVDLTRTARCDGGRRTRSSRTRASRAAQRPCEAGEGESNDKLMLLYDVGSPKRELLMAETALRSQTKEGKANEKIRSKRSLVAMVNDAGLANMYPDPQDQEISGLTAEQEKKTRKFNGPCVGSRLGTRWRWDGWMDEEKG